MNNEQAQRHRRIRPRPVAVHRLGSRLGVWALGLLGVLSCDRQARPKNAAISDRAALPAGDGGILASPLAPVCQAGELAAAGLAPTGSNRFAVVGDYGRAGPDELRVANLIKSWNPDAIFTTGDNNYPSGGADTIDVNIGQYYHEFISSYRGRFGCGAAQNRFFPSLGNHDWYTTGAQPYRDYFQLPGNERYYDVVIGLVHLFALDSDPSEPDGVNVDSVQAAWLKAGLARSTAPWKLVTMHHPPFSSGPHQSNANMQWPFKQWGADLVLGGHDHDYEHIEVDGLAYVVMGLGGASLYQVGDPVPGSLASFNKNFGAVLLTAGTDTLTTEFFTVEKVLIDRFVVRRRP